MFLGLVLTGLVVAEAAAAQQDGFARQRAPGVPLAPKPTEIYGDLARDDLRPGVDRMAPPVHGRLERKAERGAERELPMPKPVPSIIAR
ncbi:hypothetical protein DWF00_28055 [Bosea caraganae]|uniref:Uncharacterized protein n=2 Tax=Bosea caraganae TaxID=2763117 RepID=A0A370KXC5_9HYPH|nr:hypothetical protein DWE98_28815 [Bosea caraganae]RDJ21223.1 hypothetical protein DWF00_28055 [Bosea caraganae]